MAEVEEKHIPHSLYPSNALLFFQGKILATHHKVLQGCNMAISVFNHYFLLIPLVSLYLAKHLSKKYSLTTSKATIAVISLPWSSRRDFYRQHYHLLQNEEGDGSPEDEIVESWGTDLQRRAQLVPLSSACSSELLLKICFVAVIKFILQPRTHTPNGLPNAGVLQSSGTKRIHTFWGVVLCFLVLVLLWIKWM